MNTQKPLKKEGAANFVQSMLQSANERTETKAQTRFDLVDDKQLGKVMESIQKGVIIPPKKQR